MHLSYEFVILEHVFNSPFQNLVFFTAVCENPALQRSVDENGRNTKCQLLCWEYSGRTGPRLFSCCLLPRCWEVIQGGSPGFGVAKAAGFPAQQQQMPRAQCKRPGHLVGRRGPIQEGLRPVSLSS